MVGYYWEQNDRLVIESVALWNQHYLTKKPQVPGGEAMGRAVTEGHTGRKAEKST